MRSGYWAIDLTSHQTVATVATSLVFIMSNLLDRWWPLC